MRRCCTQLFLTLLLLQGTKISQNVDILPKVYLLHLKVKHCQTLRVVSTFTGQNAARGECGLMENAVDGECG